MKKQVDVIQDFKWEVTEDGYHRELRLVDNSCGLILGIVCGSRYEPKGGWAAISRLVDEHSHLGAYTTEDYAKAALLKHAYDHR